MSTGSFGYLFAGMDAIGDIALAVLVLLVPVIACYALAHLRRRVTASRPLTMRDIRRWSTGSGIVRWMRRTAFCFLGIAVPSALWVYLEGAQGPSGSMDLASARLALEIATTVGLVGTPFLLSIASGWAMGRMAGSAARSSFWVTVGCLVACGLGLGLLGFSVFWFIASAAFYALSLISVFAMWAALWLIVGSIGYWWATT